MQRCALVGMGFAGMVAAAVAASPLVAPDDDLAGARAIRIEEPVFNGRAYVYEAGKEHARTILLVHGLGDDGARDYREQIPWLARSFHVIAVDLPGFARSDKANALYSPGNYAAFLKFVADRFVRGPFVLVGHSMGGVVALRYAALHPDDVERLVVIDAPGILYRYALSSQYVSRLGLDFLPPRMDPLAQLAKVARKLLGRIERSSFDPEVILSTPALRDGVLGGDPARIAALAVALEDMSKVLPKVRAETLVIWGKEDAVAQLRTGKLLVGKLPRAQLVVIEHAGHEPMLETPERFRAALEPFLENGLAPAPVRAAEMKKQGDARCERRRNIVYEGEYDSLTLNGCDGIRISNARVRELRVEASTVTIEDSDIGGGDVGLYARGASVEMTGGRIEGEVAIMAFGSRFDLAGVEVAGRKAAMQAPEPSSVVFSICRVRSPYTNGDVHGYYALVEGNPL
ncbi:MAG: alpha/beta hydrolase [Burkholderiales bacterium]